MSARESAAVISAVTEALAGPCVLTDVAAKHGVAPSSLRRALRRRGVPSRPPVPMNKHVGLPMPEPFHFGQD